MKIAIVAGETSGDQLGAGLIKALQKRFPEAQFFGIGGPLMKKEGFNAMYDMDDISMIGLDGVFRDLPRIIRIRKHITQSIINASPRIFIGIDVPDFNLGLEKILSKHSITAIHYVSPTVWAWRKYRIKKIKQAVAKMLVLFPFEVDFYEKHNVPVTFVGHPIADEVDEVLNKEQCQIKFKLDPTKRVIALLPGSRQSEIQRHSELFLQTAERLAVNNSEIQFLISAANNFADQYINQLIEKLNLQANIKVISSSVREVINASDLVLAASGTVTLETALLQRPLIMAYRVSKLSQWLVKSLAYVNNYAIPNFLTEKPLVEEYVQEQASVDNLSKALDKYLKDDRLSEIMVSEFAKIKTKLKQNANENAANEVAKYLN